MRFLYSSILVLVCCVQSVCAQTVIRGRVYDSLDQSGLPYATVGIAEKHFGTLSDADGNFSLTIADTLPRTDTLTFSYLGYEVEKRCIADIDSSQECLVGMRQQPYQIEEVTIHSGKVRHVKIGRRKIGNDWFSTSFFYKDRLETGEECGVVLNSRYDCQVERLSFFVKRNFLQHAKFRLTFYTAEKGWPKSVLGDRDFHFDLSDGYEGWVDLDLSDCGVYLKSGDFAVTITLLEGKHSTPDSKSHLGGLELPMSISLLSRYTVISREHAMGQWVKDKMTIPFYLETAVVKSWSGDSAK